MITLNQRHGVQCEKCRGRKLLPYPRNTGDFKVESEEDEQFAFSILYECQECIDTDYNENTLTRISFKA